MDAPAPRRSLFVRAISYVTRWLDGLRLFIVNALFLALLVAFLIAVFSSSMPEIEKGTALTLELRGRLVEAPTPTLPLQALGAPTVAETVLSDVLDAIALAIDDERIAAIVLDVDDLVDADLAKATAIGDALDAFRAGGRPVLVIGSAFNQQQYLLASHADTVHLHPMGEVLLTGFAMHDLYMREAIERLGVNVHIFRVGDYKSAVEPFLRDDMSEAAKAANAHVIAGQWQILRDRIGGNRKLSAAAVDDYVTAFAAHATTAAGDLATLAKTRGLVDALTTGHEFETHLIDRFGADDGGHVRRIGLDDYLAAARTPEPASEIEIAVLTARGGILLDDPRGTDVGALQLVAEVRKLREDDRVKAIVLRIDSPGGSAFASELIREALQIAQQDGKPVVASMSGVAASGGYWIAASADEVWADPATITGSIGIFGIVPTFERSLAKIGVRADGVSTGPMAAGINPLLGLSDAHGQVLAASIEFGYRRFIDIVADGRGLERTAVEALAAGRIWTGNDALEHKLVDGLGGLDDAIGAAARIAGLQAYTVRKVRREAPLGERLLGNLAGQMGLADSASVVRGTGHLLASVLEAVDGLMALDDPRGVYALCTAC